MSDIPPPGQTPEQPPPDGGWGPPPPPPPPQGGYGQPAGQPGQPYQQYGYGYGYGQYAEYAGFWARFGAVFIDSLIIGIPSAIITAAMAPGLGLLVRLAIGVVYVGTLEGGPRGQTLGRRAVSLRVVDAETGQPGIGFGRAAGRYLGKIVSALVLGLGFFWMLWDPKKQTWHDKFVDTIVVKAV